MWFQYQALHISLLFSEPIHLDHQESSGVGRKVDQEVYVKFIADLFLF